MPVVWIGAGLIVFGLASYYHFYIRRFFRLHLHKTLKGKHNALLWILCILLMLPCLKIGSLYTIIVLHLMVISAVLDAVYYLSRRNEKVGKVCTTGVLAVCLTALVMALGAYNMFHVIRVDYTLHTDKNANFSIVLISDVHTTGLSSPEHVAKYCEEISALNPDFVLLDGDIFEEETTLADLREVARLLGGIQCKQGVFFAYGNHDNSFYTDTPNYTPDDVRSALGENGITILQDEAVTLGNVTLVGRSDVSLGPRKATAELLDGIDPDNYIVVMDHQPVNLEENAEAGADLQLSGHTHGGQIFPLGVLMQWITGWLKRGSREIGDFTAITSSGFAGWAYPLKTEGRSEYLYIQIVP